MKIFEKANLGTVVLNNRIIRSATFEGMGDSRGFPLPEYKEHYKQLATGGVGGIITGFSYISPEGKAMHPGQVGMDEEEKIEHFLPITEEVHKLGSRIFMQLAHTGRQTCNINTGYDVWGASTKKSFYFRSIPKYMETSQVYETITRFAQCALYAKKAGFDGVQLHAAHGYLIHQFLLPSINNRRDIFAIDKDTRLGTYFLDKVIDAVRDACGRDFALLVKISGGDDELLPFTLTQFKHLIYFLDIKKVDGIEISYGTMDYPFNIFRGSIPYKAIFKYNPVFGKSNTFKERLYSASIYPLMRLKTKPFTPTYNKVYAKIAKEITDIPIITVGGFRTGKEIEECLKKEDADFVSLCRPFICEQDIVNKIKKDRSYISKCNNCNTCAVMCDSEKPTQCYRRV